MHPFFKNIIVFLAICIFSSIIVQAQMNEWNFDTLDNAQLTVQYRFNKYIDVNGNDSLIIEDKTTLIDNISFNKCIELMKDVSMHKEFSGDQKSEKIRELSSSESLVYYYTKNPWPIKNSDCVARMESIIDNARRNAVFIFSAAPLEYEKSNVSRMIQYDVRYSFQELPDGQVKITINGKTSPPVKVPFWMVKSAFPGVPAKAIRKIAKLTQK